MDKKNEITLEGVIAGFDAMLAKSAAEFDRKLEQSRVEYAIRDAEKVLKMNTIYCCSTVMQCVSLK